MTLARRRDDDGGSVFPRGCRENGVGTAVPAGRTSTAEGGETLTALVERRRVHERHRHVVDTPQQLHAHDRIPSRGISVLDLKPGRPGHRVNRPVGSIGPVLRRACQPPLARKMRGTELTERQQEVLDRIRAHIREHGMPPSRSELRRSLKLVSKSGMAHYLQTLERKGWIQLTPGKDRGIQLLREGTPVFDPDKLAEVAAGTPTLADESAAAWRIPDDMAQRIHPQADFYLVVRGDSMSCVGYQTGDIIAVKRTPDASDGEIVVARIESDITVKCFHRTGPDRIELQPRSSNPEHKAIVIDGQTTDWEIVGVVVGAMTGAPPAAGC